MSWYHSWRGYPVVHIDALVLGHTGIEEPVPRSTVRSSASTPFKTQRVSQSSAVGRSPTKLGVLQLWGKMQSARSCCQ